MKHSTPDSMKFKKLQRRLGESRRGVVGLLELLWIATQKNAPEGDIGKYSNEEIAIECDWEDDPDLLVTALLETGWLDECETHRLVVHDWEEHAPAWIKRQVARHKKSFVTANSSLNVPNDGLETVSSFQTVTDDRLEATPNLTKPNLTQPNIDRSIGTDRQEEIKQLAQEILDTLRTDVRTEKNPAENRSLAYRTAVMDFLPGVNGDVSEALQRVRTHIRGPTPPKNSFSYWRKAVQDVCEKAGLDFFELERQIEVPEKPQREAS